jgi:hypothetical protein
VLAVCRVGVAMLLFKQRKVFRVSAATGCHNPVVLACLCEAADTGKQSIACHPIMGSPCDDWHSCCSKIAEAEAAVSIKEKKWLVMHMHVQLRLDEVGTAAQPQHRR